MSSKDIIEMCRPKVNLIKRVKKGIEKTEPTEKTIDDTIKETIKETKLQKDTQTDLLYINDRLHDSHRWIDFIYDKYAGNANGNGDHAYNNRITKMLWIDDLNDGSYNYQYDDNAIVFYNNKFKNYQMLDRETFKNTNMFKPRLYHKIENGIEIIITIVAINADLIEHIILNKQKLGDENFMKSLFLTHSKYFKEYQIATNAIDEKKIADQSSLITQNMDYIIEKTMTAVDYSADERIKHIDELTIKLFEYQRCNIKWMADKEKNKKKVSFNVNDEVIIGNIYYDFYFRKFGPISDRYSFSYKGGCLIDEVGLGKTIQMIGLSIINQSANTQYIMNGKFFSKATLIFCPNQLCGQWIRELGNKINSSDDYNPTVIQLLTKRDFDKYTYNDLLDADYVVVSYTFLENKCFTQLWTNQVSNIKSFSTRVWLNDDASKISTVLSDMIKELVSNPIESLDKTNPLIQLIHWHRFVIDEFHEIYKTTGQSLQYQGIANLLPFITSDNKWVVTATPFNDKKCLHHINDFLVDYVNKNNDMNYLKSDKIMDFLSSDCFRRNTKKSVETEHTLPPITEEIRWLKFSATERMMYNAYLANHNNDKYSVYLRQLCCHPQLAEETRDALINCKTLQDIERMLTSLYKSEVDFAKRKVDGIQFRINKINLKIHKIEKKLKRKQLEKMGIKVPDDESDDEEDNLTDLIIEGEDDGIDLSILINDSGGVLTVERLKELIKKLESKKTEYLNIFNGKTATLNFFTNVIERLRKSSTEGKGFTKYGYRGAENKEKEDDDEDDDDDDKCGICLSEIPEDDIGVTKCGHIYCYECIKIVIEKYHNCPYCKTPINNKDIFMLSYERKKKDVSQEEKNKETLINDIGTKLANLVLFLKETKEHTIIFSQWDDLLKRVGRILKENGVHNIFCKGNCYQRDKAIREFNDDNKIKVIMLSSDSSAAGTNLTKASQVVFIDPIYGNYDFRKGQERQAVGRIHRLGQKAKILKVIRFIIKDSIEEEIYNINIEEDKRHAIEYEETCEIVI